ncbi:IS110 family transposase [Xanthomonas theicola]|nr:IS110 family transposase [Xanthomonas theicola]
MLVERLAPMECQPIVLEASGGGEQAVLQALAQVGLPAVRLPAQRPRALAHALSLKTKTDALERACWPWRPSASTPRPPPCSLRRCRRGANGFTCAAPCSPSAMRSAAAWRRSPARPCAASGSRGSRCCSSVSVTCSDRSHRRGRRVLACPNCPGLARSCAPPWRPGFRSWAPCIRARSPALVGLAPFNRASGRWRGQHRIQGGRADVRQVLSMATWAWIRAGSPLSHTYARLTAAGKPAKVAIVACMHKYLRWLKAIARDRATYAPPTLAFA